MEKLEHENYSLSYHISHFKHAKVDPKDLQTLNQPSTALGHHNQHHAVNNQKKPATLTDEEEEDYLDEDFETAKASNRAGKAPVRKTDDQLQRLETDNRRLVQVIEDL